MSDYEGVCSPAYQVFTNVIDIYPQYYKRLFKSFRFIQKINSLTVGIRDGKNILFKDFAEMYIPVPPLDEQKEIITHLDNCLAQFEIELSHQLNTDIAVEPKNAQQ